MCAFLQSLLSVSFSVRWLSLPRSPFFPRLSHPQSSNGEEARGDSSSTFGRRRVVQVFRVLRSPEPRLGLLLKVWESETPGYCGSSPGPSYLTVLTLLCLLHLPFFFLPPAFSISCNQWSSPGNARKSSNIFFLVIFTFDLSQKAKKQFSSVSFKNEFSSVR